MHSFYLPKENAYLRYLDLPGAEPVRVYLHGLGSSSIADYPEIVMEPCLAGRRSIIVDFLGFGFSDRPVGFDYSLVSHARTIAELLMSLGLKNCELVGHSMGGAIAITLATLYPEIIGKLVVAEGNLDNGVGGLSKEAAGYIEVDFIKEKYDEMYKNLREKAEQGSADYQSYAGTYIVCAPFAFHRSSVGLIAGTAPSMRENLVVLSIPKAFIFGELSLPDPDLDWLPAHGVPVYVVANAAHAMMNDNPAGFARAIADAFSQ